MVSRETWYERMQSLLAWPEVGNSQKQYVASVYGQMSVNPAVPTESQRVILDRFWRHYTRVRKPEVVQQAEREAAKYGSV